MEVTGPSSPSPRDPGQRAEEQSIGELVKQLSEQTQTLARKEVELAKAEVAAKGRRVGIGAGAFGAAGLTGALGLGALTAALILLLAMAIEPWVAALIVAVVCAAIAGALVLMGRTQVEEATPPVPEQAIESTKRDLEAAKRSAKEGRR